MISMNDPVSTKIRSRGIMKGMIPIIFIMLLLLGQHAQAASLDLWGVGAHAQVWECAGADCATKGGLVGIGPFVDELQSVWGASVILGDQGRVEAVASVDDDFTGLNMPDLFNFSAPAQGLIATAESWGVNAYTYSGSDTFTLELVITLGGSIAPSELSTWGNIFGFVAIVSADVYEDRVAGATDARGRFTGSDIPTITDGTVFINNTTTDTSESLNTNLSFAVNPGDSFYIWTSLETTIANVPGGISIATSSMFMDFNTISNLTAANQPTTPDPIPEPGTIALLGLGLVGLGVYARRRKSGAH